MSTNKDLLKKRTWAMTMDLFIVTTTNYFLMTAFTSFVRTIFFYFPIKAQIFLIHKFSTMTSVAMMSLMFAYFSLFYFVTNGRTMGKTIFGLKVVNADKSEITLVQAMQRSFAYFTCAMFGSFLFAMSFIRKDQKSLADLFSSSFVILEEKAAEAAPEVIAVEKQGTEFQLTLFRAMEEPTLVVQDVEKNGPESFEQNKAA